MSPPMTAPSVREALEITAGILQDMIQRGQIVVGITGTNAYYIGEGVMPTIAAALATPPAPTPSAARERIARIIKDHIESNTFRPQGTGPVEIDRAGLVLTLTPAILALLPDAAAIRTAAFEEAARELEQSYPDHAWLNAACAAIRAAAIRAAGEKS